MTLLCLIHNRSIFNIIFIKLIMKEYKNQSFVVFYMSIIHNDYLVIQYHG